MINREDMLELTRRMTVKRTSMTRIAGSYMDADGFIDGTFNINFLKLSAKDKEKNLGIAKAIPFSDTNRNLKRYKFSPEGQGAGGMWQLLMGMRSCGLKNDALMDTFYDLFAEKYKSNHAYGVFVFHDCYDIPRKAADHERLWESEEVYQYLICAVCPVTGDFEPGKPECGFLFPAYSDRSEDQEHVDVFQADGAYGHPKLLDILGISEEER
ncbi:MAG: DUF4317 family protein [Clostridiales bacterium]|nr:DUF4317 family protein [Clostridiales bacterium]